MKITASGIAKKMVRLAMFVVAFILIFVWNFVCELWGAGSAKAAAIDDAEDNDARWEQEKARTEERDREAARLAEEDRQREEEIMDDILYVMHEEEQNNDDRF